MGEAIEWYAATHKKVANKSDFYDMYQGICF